MDSKEEKNCFFIADSFIYIHHDNHIICLHFPCRLFGGLVIDIKRKAPWYLSDFKDSIHLQSLASVIFLFLATFTQNVTFGGILGNATDGYMVNI